MTAQALVLSAIVIVIIARWGWALWKRRRLQSGVVRRQGLIEEASRIRHRRIMEAERIQRAQQIKRVKRPVGENGSSFGASPKESIAAGAIPESKTHETRSSTTEESELGIAVELETNTAFVQLAPDHRKISAIRENASDSKTSAPLGLACVIGILRHITNCALDTHCTNQRVQERWGSNIYDAMGNFLGCRSITPLYDNGVQIDSYLNNGLPVSTERFTLDEPDGLTTYFWFCNGNQGLYRRQFKVICNGSIEMTIKDSQDLEIRHESYSADDGDFVSLSSWAETLNYYNWEVLIEDADHHQIGWQRIRSTNIHCVVDTTYESQPHRNTREHYRRQSWAEISDVGGYERFKNICKFKDAEYNESAHQPKLQEGNLLIADDWDLPLQVELSEKTKTRL